MSYHSHVTLDDVLFNRKPEPYSLRALFAFLESNMATELLDFWVTALDARNMFEPEHPRSSYSMNNWTVQEEVPLPEDPDKRRSLSKKVPSEILDLAKTKEEMRRRHVESQILMRTTYIDDDSPLCINISDDHRRSIIERCPKTLSDPPTPGLFDQAMKECERLIETNYFGVFRSMADKHALERAKLPAALPPPPKPRKSRILKGQMLTREEIAALAPKEPPPDSV